MEANGQGDKGRMEGGQGSCSARMASPESKSPSLPACLLALAPHPPVACGNTWLIAMRQRRDGMSSYTCRNSDPPAMRIKDLVKC